MDKFQVTAEQALDALGTFLSKGFAAARNA